jgi:mono/diheme cytochrome c family protein
MNRINKVLVTLTGVALLGGWTSPAAASEPTADAEAFFTQLGCIGCHGEGAAFHDEINGARGKPVDALARWIRNAPSVKPDTMMPSFIRMLDEPQARALAEWVQQRVATSR